MARHGRHPQTRSVHSARSASPRVESHCQDILPTSSNGSTSCPPCLLHGIKFFYEVPAESARSVYHSVAAGGSTNNNGWTIERMEVEKQFIWLGNTVKTRHDVNVWTWYVLRMPA